MANRGTSFSLKDPAAGDKMVKMLLSVPGNVDKEMLKRMNTAVGIVYQIARQKRPYITQKQAKSEGRRKIRGSNRYHLVSDPDAKAGVAVAQQDGGKLQASIKNLTSQSKGKTTGIIWVDDPGYADYLEFGTARMPARPFMRPALLLTKDALSRLFNKKLTW